MHHAADGVDHFPRGRRHGDGSVPGIARQRCAGKQLVVAAAGLDKSHEVNVGSVQTKAPLRLREKVQQHPGRIGSELVSVCQLAVPIADELQPPGILSVQHAGVAWHADVTAGDLHSLGPGAGVLTGTDQHPEQARLPQRLRCFPRHALPHQPVTVAGRIPLTPRHKGGRGGIGNKAGVRPIREGQRIVRTAHHERLTRRPNQAPPHGIVGQTHGRCPLQRPPGSAPFPGRHVLLRRRCAGQTPQGLGRALDLLLPAQTSGCRHGDADRPDRQPEACPARHRCHLLDVCNIKRQGKLAASGEAIGAELVEPGRVHTAGGSPRRVIAHEGPAEGQRAIIYHQPPHGRHAVAQRRGQQQPFISRHRAAFRIRAGAAMEDHGHRPSHRVDDQR